MKQPLRHPRVFVTLLLCLGLASCGGQTKPESKPTPIASPSATSAVQATETAVATPTAVAKATVTPTPTPGATEPAAPSSEVPAEQGDQPAEQPAQPAQEAPVQPAEPPAPAGPPPLAEAMAIPDKQLPIPPMPILSKCDSDTISQRLLALINQLPTQEEAHQLLVVGNEFPQDVMPGESTEPPGSGKLNAYLRDTFGTDEFNARQFVQDIAMHAQIELCHWSTVNDDGTFSLLMWPNRDDVNHHCGAIGYLSGVIRDGKMHVDTATPYSDDLELVHRENCFMNGTYRDMPDDWNGS